MFGNKAKEIEKVLLYTMKKHPEYFPSQINTIVNHITGSPLPSIRRTKHDLIIKYKKYVDILEDSNW